MQSDTFIAKDELTKAVLKIASKASLTDSPIMVSGETGTGKSHLAKWIHTNSSYKKGAFITIHLPSIPTEMVESEIFGVEAGTATGVSERKGLIEAGDGGIAFLDGIDCLPFEIQAKLLRVVESKTVMRIGSIKQKEISIQFISSLTSPLEEVIAKGLLRNDLLYRLRVIDITLPALRNRKLDILPMAHLFAAMSLKIDAPSHIHFSKSISDALLNYNWPGNVRELKNIIQQAFIIAHPEQQLRIEHLPEFIFDSTQNIIDDTKHLQTLKEIKESYIRKILAHFRGNKTKTANILGISRKSLWEYLKRNGE